MLSLISAPYRVALTAGIAVLLMAAGFWVGRTWEHRARVAEVATLRADHAETLRDIAVLTQAATDAIRKTENQWAVAQEESARATQSQLDAFEVDRTAAGVASGSLLQQLAKYRRAAAGTAAYPSATPGLADQPGGDTIGVLADVLARADARAGVVEQYADRLKIVGAACERDYDSLGRGF